MTAPFRSLRWRPSILVPACAFVSSTPLNAQAAGEGLHRALMLLRQENSWTLERQVHLCEIPAPPFQEYQRGRAFAEVLADLGLSPWLDGVGNVVAERSGSDGGPTVVLSGHLDTVFPPGTDATVTREGTALRGPGISDDCRGLAVVLAVARAFQRASVETRGPILFVGTVGEEGVGNLRGVRALFEETLVGRVDYFISVDGAGYGITSAAVGSNRYRVRYRGPGGHSYGNFGIPNPIHALGRAIAKVAELRTSTDPKTTFNVGLIRGGTSVNSIAGDASMDVDLRSESPTHLAAVDSMLRVVLHEALVEERARWSGTDKDSLTLDLDTLGIRPAAVQADTALIVRSALSTIAQLGKTARTAAASTDANLPMSLGIPAVTIGGGGSGGAAHSTREWYDDGRDGYVGGQWAALLSATLAGFSRQIE